MVFALEMRYSMKDVKNKQRLQKQKINEFTRN